MILFIDDEPQYVDAFLQAFEFSGIYSKIITTIDAAWSYINENPEEIDAIILDIMMSPGHLFSDFDSKGGLETGFLFIERMKDFNERIPIIVLTNTDRKKFKKIQHNNCYMYEKKSTDPWKLVGIYKDLLKGL